MMCASAGRQTWPGCPALSRSELPQMGLMARDGREVAGERTPEPDDPSPPARRGAASPP